MMTFVWQQTEEIKENIKGRFMVIESIRQKTHRIYQKGTTQKYMKA